MGDRSTFKSAKPLRRATQLLYSSSTFAVLMHSNPKVGNLKSDQCSLVTKTSGINHSQFLWIYGPHIKKKVSGDKLDDNTSAVESLLSHSHRSKPRATIVTIVPCLSHFSSTILLDFQSNH